MNRSGEWRTCDISHKQNLQKYWWSEIGRRRKSSFIPRHCHSKLLRESSAGLAQYCKRAPALPLTRQCVSSYMPLKRRVLRSSKIWSTSLVAYQEVRLAEPPTSILTSGLRKSTTRK